MKPAAFRRLLDTLERAHGRPEPPPATDPFELVLWETAAYLVDDERRARVLARLARDVGTTPREILAADDDALGDALAEGGMDLPRRVARVREAARIAGTIGDLDVAARRPLAEAVRAFHRFPGLGKPGAAKIVLFSGAQPAFTLESNGLRVLQRFGAAPLDARYDAAYRAAAAALADAWPRTCDAAIRAYLLLREHGRRTCRNKAPDCPGCPLARTCAHARES